MQFFDNEIIRHWVKNIAVFLLLTEETIVCLKKVYKQKNSIFSNEPELRLIGHKNEVKHTRNCYQKQGLNPNFELTFVFFYIL